MKFSLIKIQILIISFTSLIMFYVLYNNSFTLPVDQTGKWVYILSVTGIIELMYIIHSWKIITGRYITLYTFFIIFFFLFNYGQSLFWALGIHNEGEIGSKNLYFYLSTPTDEEILRTQLLVLVSGHMIHFGATFFKKQIKKDESNFQLYLSNKVSNSQNELYKFSKLISPVVIFSEYINLIINYKNAQNYGYTALYYNPDVTGANVIFKILSRLFIPVLIGMLIGSSYNPKVVRFAYMIFGIDIILSILIGDRGGWFYGLCMIIICHHYFYKRIKFKQLVSFTIFGVFISYISVAIVALRNSGVTIAKLVTTVNDLDKNPVVSSIFNMGSSMGVTTVLVMDGWDIFPYGNSFLYGLLIAPTKDVIKWLDLDYQSVGSWFSQNYLGISNGAGFSIVAEVLINFGPYMLPFFMSIFGLIVFWITDIEYKNQNTEIIKIFFSIVTTIVLVNISRNVFNYIMGEILYTTIQFLVYFKSYQALSKYVK